MTRREIKIELVEWEGGPPALYLNDQRITDRKTKPLGGGKTVRTWMVCASDIFDALPIAAAPPSPAEQEKGHE